MRTGYDVLGPDAYYATHSADYRNPHEKIIVRLLERWAGEVKPGHESSVLDLACGSGEITTWFLNQGFANITGIDPFTGPAYLKRTGREALIHDFAAICNGVLTDYTFNYIFCSFAMHLAEPSRLPVLCMRLAEVSNELIILTPHKRPDIQEHWGWHLEKEWLLERVRLRHYRNCQI